MRDAVICEPLRTPVGGFGGVFRDVPPAYLAATVIEALVQRTSLQPREIDDVILGQGYPNGEAPAIGRVAALDAGLGIEVPGLQIDRRCGAGLQAIMLGCMQVQTGASELVLAGGAESMSQAEFYATGIRWGVRGSVELADRLARPRVTAGGQRHVVDGGMIETAENLRRDYAISRADQDALALRSHQRAVAAQEDGTFAEEIVPVTVKTRKQELSIERDEHPRADTTLERLAALKPIMGRSDPDATVTAGNASGQNDGAAVCIVTHPEKAAELGLAAVRAPGLLVRRRRRARDDGDRARPGHAQGAAARRSVARRDGPDRAQRGVRRAGTGRDRGVGPARRARARQRARLRHLARASRSAPPEDGS